MPAPLAQALGADWVTTTQSMGWASIKNGALLALAEKEFDIFITSDQNMRYQQNLSKRSIAILLVPTNRWPVLIEHIEEILESRAVHESEGIPNAFLVIQFETRKLLARF